MTNKKEIVQGLIEVYNDNKLSERDECNILNALEHLGFDVRLI